MPAITRIQVRRDTATNWSSDNPVLYAGEVGYVTSGTNAGKFKVGNGTTAWNSLAFFSPLDITITSPGAGQVLKYNGTSWVNDSDSSGMTNPMTTAGDIIYGGASGTPTRLGIGTAGQVLKVNSGATAVEWGTDNGMTNPMTTAGDIIYGGASGTPTRLGLGTAGQVLKVNSGATSVEWGLDSSSPYENISINSLPNLYDAPTVVGTSSQDFGSSTTGTFTLPSGAVSGDLVIVLVGSDGSTPTLPTFWSDLNSTTSGTEFQRIFYRTVPSSGWTGTVSLSGMSTSSTAVAILIRNYSGNPAITTSTGSSGMPDAPSVTTTVDNALVIAFGALDDDNIVPTVPSGYSNLTYQSASTTGQTTMLATKVVATAGAEDPAAFGGSGTDDWVAHTVIVSGPAVINFDVSTSQVNYYTGTLTADFSINFRGNSTTTLNSVLTNNQLVRCNLLVTNGGVAYQLITVSIDGTPQTVEWTSTPTAFTNSIESYSFTIIKTASNTFTVLGNKERYT